MTKENQKLLDFIKEETRICRICGERTWAKLTIKLRGGLIGGGYLCDDCLEDIGYSLKCKNEELKENGKINKSKK